MDSAVGAPALEPAGAAWTGSSAGQPLQRAFGAISKVPEITVYFWIVKLLTTAMG